METTRRLFNTVWAYLNNWAKDDYAWAGFCVVVFYTLIFVIIGLVRGRKHLREESATRWREEKLLRRRFIVDEFVAWLIIPILFVLLGGFMAVTHFLMCKPPTAYCNSPRDDLCIDPEDNVCEQTLVYDNRSEGNLNLTRSYLNSFGVVTVEFQKLTMVALGLSVLVFAFILVVGCLDFLYKLLRRLLKQIPIRW